MSSETNNTPRVYVGTYHKYASGSIKGEWLDVDDFRDKESFLEACAELHKDEQDPEFMFQDHENIPDSYISESNIKDELWDEYLTLDESERTILELYRGDINQDASWKEASDCFQGIYSSLEDYVIEYWESTGEYKQDDRNGWSPINYVDWERMAHDLEQSGDIHAIEHDGSVYVFNNY